MIELFLVFVQNAVIDGASWGMTWGQGGLHGVPAEGRQWRSEEQGRAGHAPSDRAFEHGDRLAVRRRLRSRGSAARAPGLRSPANGVTVQSLLAFTWHGVRGAATYQFEFSADRSFSSGVAGFGQGPVSLATTAITHDKTITNGTYYWRCAG